MEDNGVCPHFSAKVQDDELGPLILATYQSVVAWGLSRFQYTKNAAKRRKISSPSCHTCKVHLARPFACLQCSYTGCWTDKHILDHLGEEEHIFGVDAKLGFVFCSECNDFIYHSQLEDLRLQTLIAAEEKLTRFQVAQKPREPYQVWKPTEKESDVLQTAMAIPCQGRRGLLNLGQTCFMNAVLQCLAHNPLLRNYFLGDRHNSKQCKTENCTCCEMDRFFSEIYSDDSNPYGPVSFLATTWRASAELSGYAQQDAHEFFISALNQIHSTSRGSTNVSCNCVVHNTFSGQLQSDVKCERCGNVTSTIDPMLDISLELKDKANDGPGGNTLAGCLRRFTHPEKLGSKEYSCSKCGKAHEASKRLSIRKLPPVLSFQFKRFEYTSADKSSARKVDAPVRFPATINMAPFTTLAMNSSEKEKTGVLHTAPGPHTIYEYDLFAVINHEGQMDNGHYTNYARFQDEVRVSNTENRRDLMDNQWYRFDDDKVASSNLGACLGSAAYMCFYVKRHLDYKPFMKPTYVLTRESEAIREKEMEKEKEAARLREVEDALLATL